MAKTLGNVHNYCSDTVPECGLAGQWCKHEPMPKFGHGAESRVQGRDLRQRSHLEPGHGARVEYSTRWVLMWTDVNRHSF